jgi:hypothetical protein
MADDKKTEIAKAAQAILPSIATMDDRVLKRTEDEIESVVSEVLHPYLMETIPQVMRKLNHQGVFDKAVRSYLDAYLKNVLAEFMEQAKGDLLAKIERKFREAIAAEYEPRVEQAAKKLLDETLAKVKREFAK